MPGSSRRQFLKNAGLLLATPPVHELLHIMLGQNLANAAQAELERYYISFSLYGAPSRWQFDHFLKIRDNESIHPNSQTPTAILNSQGTYSTFKYRNSHVPSLWSSQVPTSSGLRPMSSLLDNMLVFRGYGSGVDGHASNMIRQLNPLGGVGSLGGHIADLSPHLVKALTYQGGVLSSFQSVKGNGIVPLYATPYNAATPESGNLLKNMLNSFLQRPETRSISSLRSKYQSLMEQFSDILKASSHSLRDYPGSESVGGDRKNAIRMIEGSIEDLDASWSELYQRYANILHSAYKAKNIEGLSASPVVASDDGVSQETPYSVFASDAATVLFPINGTDIRTWVDSAHLNNLIRSFALAEFAVTRRIGGALEFVNLQAMNLAGSFARTSGGGGAQSAYFNQVFDEHNVGHVASLYINGCFYRALAAGLCELTDKIKAKGLFDKTFIHIASDFGRTPRASQGGSDHGFNAMVSSIISGTINAGPYTVGNIMRDASASGLIASNYPGTFGWNYLTRVGSSSVLLNPTHVASTIATLMQIPQNPWINFADPLAVRGQNGIEIRASSEIVG